MLKYVLSYFIWHGKGNTVFYLEKYPASQIKRCQVIVSCAPHTPEVKRDIWKAPRDAVRTVLLPREHYFSLCYV